MRLQEHSLGVYVRRGSPLHLLGHTTYNYSLLQNKSGALQPGPAQVLGIIPWSRGPLVPNLQYALDKDLLSEFTRDSTATVAVDCGYEFSERRSRGFDLHAMSLDTLLGRAHCTYHGLCDPPHTANQSLQGHLPH